MDKKIIISKDGPCLVSGGIPLSKMFIETDSEGASIAWRESHKYDVKNNYALCRCGKSKNMPFCDGSHMDEHFDGTETASMATYIEQAERIEGKSLVLYDATELCASARFCDRAGSIWSLIMKDDAESHQTAIEEAADCSSGRLVLEDKKTGEMIEPFFEPSIVVTEDPAAGVSGPLWVRGKVQIEAENGEVYETRNRVTLCRCGKSENKPFCDTAHIPSKFDDGNISDQGQL